MSDELLPAVPLLVARDGAVPLGGTGFFVEMSGVQYLVTAAHVPVGTWPTADWSKWADRLTLGVDGMPTVSLFADSAFGRRPRFHFLRSSDDSNKLVDVIALPCAPQDLGIDTFRVFSTKAVVPDLDKDVTAFGYATNVPAWPEGSARGGQIICDDQAFLVANLDTPEGFSGGPVTSAAGSLIGVLVGQGRPGLEDSHDRIVVVGIVDILPQLKDGILPPHASVPFFPPPVN